MLGNFQHNPDRSVRVLRAVEQMTSILPFGDRGAASPNLVLEDDAALVWRENLGLRGLASYALLAGAPVLARRVAAWKTSRSSSWCYSRLCATLIQREIPESRKGAKPAKSREQLYRLRAC